MNSPDIPVSVIKNIFIAAGERSGDMHGSSLVRELHKLNPNCKFSGIGGNQLSEQGVNILYHVNELAAIGILDVIKKYVFFRKVLSDCIAAVKKINADVVILIDYPGFNIKFAERIKKKSGCKVIYYISPQVWAWNPSRVYKLSKFTDKILVILPFEKDFYKKFGIDVDYAGHPLVNRIDNFLSTYQPVKKVFGEDRIVTILPGSREQEIRQHLPVLLKVSEQLLKEFKIKIFISRAEGLDQKLFSSCRIINDKISITGENPYKLIADSELVITKAGTSTVECALIGTPFMTFYKTAALNYHILKPFVKIRNLGMVNILAGKNIVREFVQNEFTSENILLEARKILTDTEYVNSMKRNLSDIRNILGNTNASKNAATIIHEILLKR